MSTVSELLARIIADPFDDDLRGVYADTLATAGDPQGELITIERTLDRLGIATLDDLVFSSLDGAELQRAIDLVKRARELARVVENNRRGIFLRRGFGAYLDPENFEDLVHGLETAPITELGLRFLGDRIAEVATLRLDRIRTCEVTTSDMPALRALLAAMPRLERLRLDVGLDEEEDPPFDIGVLATCTRLVDLELQIGGPILATPELLRLCTMPFAAALRRLAIWPFPATALVQFPALERAELGRIDGSVHGIARLPRSFSARISSIDDGFLFAASEALASVEELDVEISDEAARAALLASTHLRVLRRLRIAPVSSDESLARMPVKLERLHVSGEIPADAVAPIMRAHALESLRTDHGGNADIAHAIAGEPAASMLRELWIDSANVGDEGAEVIAASPHLRNLRRLRVRANGIYSPGFAALAASPNMANVVSLDIDKNGAAITSPAVVALLALPHLVETFTLLTTPALLVVHAIRVAQSLPEILAKRNLQSKLSITAEYGEANVPHARRAARAANDATIATFERIVRVKSNFGGQYAGEVLEMARVVRDLTGGVILDTLTETIVT